MKVFKFLFFVIYNRWYKKDRDATLASVTAIMEITLYTSLNLSSVFWICSSLFFGDLVGHSQTKYDRAFYLVPCMLVLWLIWYQLIGRKSKRDAIINEFSILSRKNLMHQWIGIVLYASLSILLLWLAFILA